MLLSKRYMRHQTIQIPGPDPTRATEPGLMLACRSSWHPVLHCTTSFGGLKCVMGPWYVPPGLARAIASHVASGIFPRIFRDLNLRHGPWVPRTLATLHWDERLATRWQSKEQPLTDRTCMYRAVGFTLIWLGGAWRATLPARPWAPAGRPPGCCPASPAPPPPRRWWPPVPGRPPCCSPAAPRRPAGPPACAR